MQAWKIEKLSLESQVPAPAELDTKALWQEDQNFAGLDREIQKYWGSRVPGSLARDTLAVAAIQAVENRGLKVKNSAELLLAGFRAITEQDLVGLHQATHQLFAALREAEKEETAAYWQQEFYDDFASYAQKMPFLTLGEIDWGESLEAKIYGGWLGQIIGAAYGTCLEGYSGDNLAKAYARLDQYVRPPNTYNDDLTYELALLVAYEKQGAETSSCDIAWEWLGRLGSGWSAEGMALRNLRSGILPPLSGRFNNPFYEWIGAQMRGAIVGQLYPGNLKGAAQAAWQDGEISHWRNGILGEVFNAVLVAGAFAVSSLADLLELGVSLIPADSEYGQIIRQALAQCRNNSDWQAAWKPLERELEQYNWVHCYPNAVIEIVALWFGQGDFTRTLEICGRCGLDVDCNAAQAMAVWGTIYGAEAIPAYWKEPLGDELNTLVRGMEVLSLKQLAARTAKVARKLAKIER